MLCKALAIDRGCQRSLFRSGRPKRQNGPTDYAISYTDPSETSYLMAPHVVCALCWYSTVLVPTTSQPFALDYHQTLLSLLDVLSEVYNKLSKILGPSPFPSQGQHMMGPLGLLSPHPGVSYLFSSMETTPANDNENTLWGIANSAGASVVYSGALGSPPPSWTTALGDSVRQIDGKLKVRCLHLYFLGAGTQGRTLLMCRPSETHRHALERARRLCANRDQRGAGLAGSTTSQCSGPRRGSRTIRLRRMTRLIRNIPASVNVIPLSNRGAWSRVR